MSLEQEEGHLFLRDQKERRWGMDATKGAPMSSVLWEEKCLLRERGGLPAERLWASDEGSKLFCGGEPEGC